jgi:hypothetical protein
VISEEEFEEFNSKWKEAARSLRGREELMNAIAEKMEVGL